MSLRPGPEIFESQLQLGHINVNLVDLDRRSDLRVDLTNRANSVC